MAAAKSKSNKDKTEEIPIEETVETVEEKNEFEIKADTRILSAGTLK